MLQSFAEIIIVGLFSAWLCRLVRIPDLIGYLFTGMLFGPAILGTIDPSLITYSGEFRTAALIVILLRAGLALQKNTLKTSGRIVILLALLPPMAEAGIIAVISPLVTSLTHYEGFLLGLILSAVSPAAVVPAMLRFRNEKRGNKHAIPEMVLSVSSLNNVITLMIFTLLIGFGTDLNAIDSTLLLNIPIGIVNGIIIGILAGFLLIIIFKYIRPDATRKALIMLAIPIVLLRIESETASVFPFSALLSTIVMGYMLLNRQTVMATQMSGKFAKIWIAAEMILFTLVGSVADPVLALETGISGIIIIFSGLLIRSAMSYLLLIRTKYDISERHFIVIAGTPKATVQAAVGAMPLTWLIANGQNVSPGETILAIAVMSIILTAPLGAIAIEWTGKKWLTQEK